MTTCRFNDSALIRAPTEACLPPVVNRSVATTPIPWSVVFNNCGLTDPSRSCAHGLQSHPPLSEPESMPA